MEPARETFWNIPHWAEIAQYVLGGLTIAVFLAGLYWRFSRWRRGRSEPWRQPIVDRLKDLVRYGLFQGRLTTSDPYAAVMHLAIFWSMVVLAIGTAVATVDWDVTRLLFGFQFLRGGVYYLFELVLDIFGVLLLVGLLMAAFRRYLVRPRSLQMSACPRDRWNSAYLLGILLLIGVTGFLVEGLRIEEGFRAAERAQQGLKLSQADQAGVRNVAAAAWAPVGLGVAKLLSPLSSETLRGLHRALWWVHALAAFGFIASVPFTKAFHLISSPLNIFLADRASRDRLASQDASGVRTLSDFTWKQLLEIDACTWCGKCLDACPMGESGLPHPTCSIIQRLQLMLDRATSWLEPAATRATALAAPIVAANGSSGACATGCEPEEGPVPAEDLWSCCMCRACEVRCPVLIEHPRIIVDLRRHLVDQGRVDEGLQDALTAFQRYGNSFGQSARKRPDWSKPLDFKLKDARKEEVEYLWFVGDYASYDQRAQEVTRAIAKVLHRGGVDMGLLFDKEQNAGNDVRRIGEEGLFAMLREKNCKELAKANYRKLLTSDPHTYNTLKNEYMAAGPSGNGNGADAIPNVPVLHYTELLDELIRQGKLQPKRLELVATYHDPCYLGRFNGVYDAPRRVLAALGVTLVEMPRNRANSFCCGAGGGRIWMKDTPGLEERPAENRVKEALALPDVQCLVVACPKDLVMFQDAVKTVGAERRLRVADLGELVLEALEGDAAGHEGAAADRHAASNPSPAQREQATTVGEPS